jgi:multidrug efflux pump subunit AcrA (membrane-fusion protein)
MRPGTILFSFVMVGILLVGAVVGLKAYKSYKKPPEETKVITRTIPVHVSQAATGSVEDVVYVTGSVEAADRVDCYAKIPTPGKLIEAKVKKGDHVGRDQVLITVDRDEIGATYMPYAVKAPSGGEIAFIQDAVGAFINAQQPVATIIRTDEVKVKTTLIEADLQRIKEGTSARIKVDAYPDRVFTGTVTRVNPMLEVFSHTAPIEITVSNSDQALKPAMFARIELVADSKSGVVMLPRANVIRREGKPRCFVVNPDFANAKKPVLRVKLTDLQLGYYDLNNYEVVSGVNAGDLVVDQDLVVLKDGSLVSVVNPPDGWTDPTKTKAGEDAKDSAPKEPAPPTPKEGAGATPKEAPGATPKAPAPANP